LSPRGSYGGGRAKAEALTQFDEPAVRAILTENGDWDAGLAALADPAARDVQFRVIRGDPAAGGMIPDALWPGFLAGRRGARRARGARGGGGGGGCSRGGVGPGRPGGGGGEPGAPVGGAPPSPQR